MLIFFFLKFNINETLNERARILMNFLFRFVMLNVVESDNDDDYVYDLNWYEIFT